MKTHLIGTQVVGGQRKTACNTFMAEGHYSVSSTDDFGKVTCARCLRSLRCETCGARLVQRWGPESDPETGGPAFSGLVCFACDPDRVDA